MSKELNERCSQCACVSWGCPADEWSEDGTALEWLNTGERNEINTSFCFERKKEDEAR